MNRDFYAGIHLTVSMLCAALCIHFFDAQWWWSQAASAGYLILAGLWEQRK